MILAALRGFLIGRLTSGNTTGVEAGFEALARALDREEAALVGFHNRVMVFDLRRRGGPPAIMPPAGTQTLDRSNCDLQSICPGDAGFRHP